MDFTCVSSGQLSGAEQLRAENILSSRVEVGDFGRFLGIVPAAILGLSISVFGETALFRNSPVELKKLSLEELMGVEVTSVSRRPEKWSSAAAAVQFVSSEDIRRSGATTLPEALRLAPNLEVAQVDSRQWAISSRGFNNTLANKMLVLIDGRSVYTPLFAGVFWDVQDTLMEDVDRIEVISGPGASVWGANAVNGVINVMTKSSADTQGTYLSGGVGTELQDFAAVRYGGEISPTLHYRVYGKYFDRDSTVFPNGLDAGNGWRKGQGGFRMDWNPSNVNAMVLQGDLYDGKIEQLSAPMVSMGGGNLLGRWTRTFSEDSSLAVQAYYDRTHRKIPGTFAENLDTWDLDIQHRVAIGERNDVVWGGGYRLTRDQVENSPLLAFLPPDEVQQLFSLFAQDSIALIPDELVLTVGSKVEHNDFSGIEIEPSGRLAWTFAPDQTVWGAISRAVRAPSRVDRELYAPGIPPFTTLAGGPNFKSEEMVSYELGYRAQVHRQVTLAVSTFYNQYDRLRSSEPLQPPAPIPFEIGNGLEGESYGAELSGEYRVMKSWRLRGGYTYMQVHVRATPGSGDKSGGRAEANDPNHQVMAYSSWDLPHGLELDAGFRYISRIAVQDLPEYSELWVRLGWQVSRHLELSILGENLLHGQHPEFGPAAARQEIQRSIFGRMTCRF